MTARRVLVALALLIAVAGITYSLMNGNAEPVAPSTNQAKNSPSATRAAAPAPTLADTGTPAPAPTATPKTEAPIQLARAEDESLPEEVRAIARLVGETEPRAARLLPDANGREVIREVLYTLPEAKYPEVLVREIRSSRAGYPILRAHAIVANQVLLKLAGGAREADLLALNDRFGATVLKNLPNTDLYLVQLKDSGFEAVQQATADYMAAATTVAYAEPNFLLFHVGYPNDSGFDKLWGLDNQGQTGGTKDADIDAVEAWDKSTGSMDVVVGVIDTGVDYNHPDLKANAWINTGEVPGNGQDDDGNGYVDDVHGYDFVNDDGDPMDDNSHGTHCAGTIGGRGDNGQGVAGVCWQVRIAGIKFLSASGSGYTSDAVSAVAYANKMGFDLTSNSWGGGGYSQSMYDAIYNANQKGALFIAAAGNSGSDNDSVPHYPSSYTNPNVIAVASTDHKDNRSSFSCYGAKSVDLGAPGSSIYSSVPGGKYASYSGTSMATPHVAGAAALVKAYAPTLDHTGIRDRLLESVDSNAALSGKTVTGGRLNVNRALSFSTPVFLKLTDAAIDDDEQGDSYGNGDGMADPGEVIELALTVSNKGSEKALGIETELFTKDGYVTVLTPNGDHGNLDPNTGSTRVYRVSISSASPGPRETKLYLNAMTDAGEGFQMEYALEISWPTRIQVDPESLSVALRGGANGHEVISVTNTGEKTLQVNLYSKGEGGGAGANGLWNRTHHRSTGEQAAWYYGRVGEWDYNTGAANSGSLTFGPVTVPNGDPNLRFSSWRETESSTAYDTCQVLVKAEGGSWALLKDVGNNDAAWHNITLGLSAYAGQKVEIRFEFDTRDAAYNAYEGWYVTDIRVGNKALDWLRPDLKQRAVFPGQTEEFDVELVTQDLPYGTYSSTVLVSSNDTKHPKIDVPVTVYITPNAEPKVESIYMDPDPAVLPAYEQRVTTILGVLATDKEEAEMVYTWRRVSGPASVEFAENGSPTADVLNATFSKAGLYELAVEIDDGYGPVTETLTCEIQAAAPVEAKLLKADADGKITLGKTLELTCEAQGGSSTLLYSWHVMAPGGAWVTIKDWHSSQNALWTPKVLGAHQVAVWVKESRSPAQYDDQIGMSISVVEPVKATALELSPAKTMTYGQGVTLTLKATGGASPKVYSFHAQAPGGEWTEIRPYHGDAFVTFKPDQVGTWNFAGWVKESDSEADRDAQAGGKITVVAPPLEAKKLTVAPDAPKAGATLTLACEATGGVELSYKFFAKTPTGDWVTIRDYDTASTATFATTMNGLHEFIVWVKDQGSEKSYDQELYAKLDVAGEPVELHGVTISHDAPQPKGTAMTISASATGENLRYKFFVLEPSGAWSTLQGYSDKASASWTPAKNGLHEIAVWVKHADSTFAQDDQGGLTFEVAVPEVALTSVELDAEGELPINVTRTITAAATGPNPLYQFFVQAPGGEYVSLGDYQASPTIQWTPAATGKHEIAVWVKHPASTNGRDDQIGMSAKVIVPPVLIDAIATNPSTSAVGEEVTLTITASGGTGPEGCLFRVWTQAPGGAWIERSGGWSNATTYAFTPTAEETGRWQIAVHAKAVDSVASFDHRRGMSHLVTQ